MQGLWLPLVTQLNTLIFPHFQSQLLGDSYTQEENELNQMQWLRLTIPALQEPMPGDFCKFEVSLEHKVSLD